MDFKVCIRKADLKDSTDIAKLHRTSFIAAHKNLVGGKWLVDASEEGFKERWERRLSSRRTHTYVAVLHQKIVGMICFSQYPRIKIAEILFLYVDPHYFRQGIGKELMTFSVKLLQKKHIKLVHIWALKNNPKSRAFYESIGARTDGTERITDIPAKKTHEVEYYLLIDELPQFSKGDRC